MKTDAYLEHLQTQGLPKDSITQQITAIDAFESWLASRHRSMQTAGMKDAWAYAADLIETGTNTPAVYDALSAYAYWMENRELYIALLEITDCHQAMTILRDTIMRDYGEAAANAVFKEPLPPLGADEATRLAHTKLISARMQALLSKQQIRAAWFQVQHGIPRAFWNRYDDNQRKKYAVCQTMDSFIDCIQDDRNAMLRQLHADQKLWYTQEVTDDALAYFEENPHMQWGEHNGRKGIIITKVPYMTDRMLHAKSETMKRYYVCHCPLVREVIRRGEKLGDDVCYCSLGHASHFLSGMGLDGLEGEVLESAVKGDMSCRFIFYLPDTLSANTK